MVLTIHTDGGSLNNPGKAAYAYTIHIDSSLVDSKGESIGIATNNVAEYTGLIKALERTYQLMNENKLPHLTKIHVFADSQLMVNQLNGLYKVKNARIRELVFSVRAIENQINIPLQYTHILRENNILADSLVKKALGR